MNMSLLSTLIVACTVSSLVMSGDYGKNDKGKYVKTARPTKYEPHSYDDGMTDLEKPSYPKWKKDSKPTVPQEYEPMYESETHDKEPVYSWFQNPYNDRTRRSAMKAQLEHRIEADMQELAALDASQLEHRIE